MRTIFEHPHREGAGGLFPELDVTRAGVEGLIDRSLLR